MAAPSSFPGAPGVMFDGSAAGVALPPTKTECCAVPCICCGASADSWCWGQCGRLRGVCRYRGCCCGFWAYLLFILAFIAVPMGVGFLAALATDERSAKISTFNAAVAAWPNASQAFARVTSVVVQGSGGALALVANTALDRFPDTADGVQLPTSTVRFSARGAVVAGASFSAGMVTSGTENATLGGAAVVNAWSTKLFTTKTACSSSNGRQSCTTTTRCLTSLCLALDDSLRLASGCALDKTVDLVGAGGLTPCDSGVYYSFGDLPVDVRSSADPYVVAFLLTNGSLDFGISQGIKAVVGGVLFAFGLLVLAGGCPLLARQPPAPAGSLVSPRSEAWSIGGWGASPPGTMTPYGAASVPYALPVYSAAMYGARAAPQGAVRV